MLASFSVPGDPSGKNPGMGCYALLQGFFITQGFNPGLPNCMHSLLSETPRKPGLGCDKQNIAIGLVGHETFGTPDPFRGQFILGNFPWGGRNKREG